MRKLFSMLLLTLAAAPAFAAPPTVNQLPEPEALALLAIGGIAMLISQRKK